MASLVACTLLFFLFSLCFTAIYGSFGEEITEATTVNRIERTTHLHFYFHDIVRGKNQAVARIAGPQDGAITSLYTMSVDDPLTEGREPTSKLVGKAQATYALAGQHDFSLLLIMSFGFTEDRYNGSSISILERHPHALENVREMPIVGGSGLFELAYGYAMARIVRIGVESGHTTVEYDVYISHY